MKGQITEVQGGVTIPQGYVAGAIHCGIKLSNHDRVDLAVISSDRPAVGAGTFTTNRIKAAPVKVSMAHMRSPETRAIIVNSGNANACTGLAGIEHAKAMVKAVAAELGIKERQVMICSTGRIGVSMPIEKILPRIPALAENLDAAGGKRVATAIMTSDTFEKEFAVRCEIGKRVFTIGGVAKGAGMIDPNMATMLAFITTDAPLAKKPLQKALSAAVEQSFNRITIDGDMSTNDTVLAMANGAAGGELLDPESPGYELFQEGLNRVTRNLARMIVEDGEGATKFVEVHIIGGANFQDARKAAEAVANSALVKCAWYGGDPNWGRIIDAIGYSSSKVREELVDIYYDGLIAVQNGVASNTPVGELKKVVANRKFTITVNLHLGTAEYTVYTTDLSQEYVEFNRTE